MTRYLGILLLAFLIKINCGYSQSAQVDLFALKEVKLLDSPFKEAMKTDLDYILKMDPDRLLAPYLKEAGLDPKAENYPNWESMGLDGHIAGHYLTALAQMYASLGDETALQRLNYMLEELERAQQANGNGYIGGVPNSKELWQDIRQGNINAHNFGLNERWVPLYNIHKTYAGLRDAYKIAGIERARKMLVDFTDWMIAETENLTDGEIQELLISEHGGLNETFADVYEITGERKYLELAYRFSHKMLLEPLQKKNDILNGLHANTQIPKVIGFETIAQLDQNAEYHQAARFFWDNVTSKRTVAIGGNSVREHFNPTDDFSSMVNSVQGPETCNTYNMLRLSEKLFQAQPEEKYIHFYERALYNHILSSQHPGTGGFVYFTPMRPGHYRVYSQPETSFWCCVGSGLENHGKYNEMIYAHKGDSLYVNLFIPSELNWKEKGVKIIQENDLESQEQTRLTFETNDDVVDFNLMVRYPSWAKENFKVKVNGENIAVNVTTGSFVSLNRKWKNGDEVTIDLPMQLRSENLPDESNYASLIYGPYVLAAKMNESNLEGLYADAGRSSHIAHGPMMTATETPVFLKEKSEKLSEQLVKENADKIKFSASGIIYPKKFQDLNFIPFYQIHEARYVIYLPVESPQSLAEIEEDRKIKALEDKRLAAVTIDHIQPGEQQPEADHLIETQNSNTGTNKNRHWRDARGWFSYVIQDDKNEADRIRVTYYGKDQNREFKIMMDGVIIATEKLNGEKGDTFFIREYKLPKEVTSNEKVEKRLRFEALEGSRTAGIYEIRILKKKE
ncbi:MAG: glycoside hydrolase family 127 protein [Christiangramia sp.]|nr:glycoside hydrolase family 127 protein [Christiangramia sp.]